MAQHLVREIERLKKSILSLGALVEQSLHRSLQALETGDLELAEEVIATDPLIDEREVELEEDVLKMLALYQPVAGDLRFIMAVAHIDNELERIADLSANICARTIDLSREPGVKVPPAMIAMAARIEAMLGRTLDALVQRDADLARCVLAEDAEVDEMFRSLLGELKEGIRRHIDLLDGLLLAFTVARYLERMADRMTNICEDVIYMVEGEIVRHQDPWTARGDANVEEG